MLNNTLDILVYYAEIVNQMLNNTLDIFNNMLNPEPDAE